MGAAAAKKGTDARIVAEVSVMVALAVALDSIRVFTLPQGGSITAGEMVPILLVALRRGVRVGVFAGVVLGIVDLYFEFFVVNPIQFFLDYPIAYGALGLAGVFKQRGPLISAIGVAFAIGCRFLSHFVSGVVFFGANAPPGENVAVYSALYNAGFLVPGLIISEFVIVVLVRAGALKFRL